jgi:two-component system chemotaxis sensor kinase CheA
MSDPNLAFLARLRAIFSDEAHEHFQEIDSCLVALEQAEPAAREALTQAILKVLHTLKGAARAVDLLDLERLCHSLEGVFARAAPALAPEQFDLLHQALGLARLLVAAPGGRVRNQALAVGAQLEALGLQLRAPSSGPAAAEPAPAAVPEAEQRSLEPADSVRSGRIRVQGKSLDAIRCQAEALLSVELSLRHQIDEMRELADAMAGQRRAGADDTSSFARRCSTLADGLDLTCGDFAGARARLMDATLETALVPFASATDELPALVRNLARSHGKQAVLSVDGESVLIDRRILGVIREALIHLVTNAVDHGIEPGAARLAAGKPAAGRIGIAVRQRDSRQVLVRVSDDGAGIDADGLADAAARQGAGDPDQLAALGQRQRLELALRAGVTTRAKVTPVSGRGMGLAIVAEKVAAVGGELLIENARGAGCAFELLLPVSLSILRGLVVGAGGARYVVPLAGLESVRALAPGDIETVENCETVLAGQRVAPLVRLAALFGRRGAAEGGALLIARAGAQGFALLVDEIVAEQDVLPKSLGPLLRRVRYISGAARLGDGSLVPIVGLDDVARYALSGLAGDGQAPGAAAPAPNRVLVVEDSITARLLLKHILESAGCRVDTAVDGLDALSRLRQQEFDAVVSDIEMPNLDGLALTAAIRADPATARLPVILVTSLQSPEQRERGLRAGADAYLTKGAFDQDKLLATVRRLM